MSADSESQHICSPLLPKFLFLSVSGCFLTEHSKTVLTFSQEVFKEPSGVVLWILQMDIGSPPGSWSVV